MRKIIIRIFPINNMPIITVNIDLHEEIKDDIYYKNHHILFDILRKIDRRMGCMHYISKDSEL